MAKELINQSYGSSIVDKEGKPTVEFFTLLEGLVNLEVRNGEGTPEGVVKARFKVFYFDEIANDLYIKKTNENLDTGWVLL